MCLFIQLISSGIRQVLFCLNISCLLWFPSQNAFYFQELFSQQSQPIVEQTTACAVANGWSALLTRSLCWKLWPWNINMLLFSHCKWITRALCLRRMGDTAHWMQRPYCTAALCGPATCQISGSSVRGHSLATPGNNRKQTGQCSAFLLGG